MKRDPDFLKRLHEELSDGRGWLDRSVVLAHAVMAGLLVVVFTLLSEWAFDGFRHLFAIYPWLGWCGLRR